MVRRPFIFMRGGSRSCATAVHFMSSASTGSLIATSSGVSPSISCGYTIHWLSFFTKKSGVKEVTFFSGFQ